MRTKVKRKKDQFRYKLCSIFSTIIIGSIVVILIISVCI